MAFEFPKAKLDNILFLDIETVSQYSDYQEMDEEFQNLWDKKAKTLLRYQNLDFSKESSSTLYVEKAAIFAEFSKVVCISVGYLRNHKNGLELRIKSFYGDHEEKLLSEFSELINNHFLDPKKFFISGHNIREFDVPFLGRRFIVNGMQLPELFNLIGKKPWESKHLLDTLEMWRFGDYKNYTSLELLAKILNVPSPKVDLDGSMVGNAYWNENRLDDIKDYCELDVITSVNVFMKLIGKDIVEEVTRT